MVRVFFRADWVEFKDGIKYNRTKTFSEVFKSESEAFWRATGRKWAILYSMPFKGYLK